MVENGLISSRAQGAVQLVALQVAALKIELERIGFAAVPAGCKEQHQVLFLDAADRDGIVLAGTEPGVFGPFDLAEAGALDRGLAAGKALGLRHGQVGPVARDRGTVAQREGRRGGGWESRCDGGEEREL